jgi:hypothetical protein
MAVEVLLRPVREKSHVRGRKLQRFFSDMDAKKTFEFRHDSLR